MKLFSEEKKKKREKKVVCVNFNILATSLSFLPSFSPGYTSTHFGEVSPTVIAVNCANINQCSH